MHMAPNKRNIWETENCYGNKLYIYINNYILSKINNEYVCLVSNDCARCKKIVRYSDNIVQCKHIQDKASLRYFCQDLSLFE